MSKIEVDTIAPQSGTQVTIGESGDTVTIPTGVTLDASNATTTLAATIEPSGNVKVELDALKVAPAGTIIVWPEEPTVKLLPLLGTISSTSILLII